MGPGASRGPRSLGSGKGQLRSGESLRSSRKAEREEPVDTD